MMKIITLVLMIAAPSANAQRRAIMEGLAASNTTVFVDTTNVRVGISTGAPQSAIHVHNGDIMISTSSGSRGIIFQDHTTQTTAVLFSTGTYTPTCTKVTNMTTCTCTASNFRRMGNWVHVDGECDLAATAGAGTFTQFDFSLPVASNISIQYTAHGGVNIQAAAFYTASCRGDATNDRINCFWWPTATTTVGITFFFDYTIE